MSKTAELKCECCKFYEGCKDGDNGTCHRHAPMPTITNIEPKCWPGVDEGPYAMWPTVFCEDWCGEFVENK